jgi:hypothetical protein
MLMHLLFLGASPQAATGLSASICFAPHYSASQIPLQSLARLTAA